MQLTKDEAIEAMKSGMQVTHYSFGKGEWMKYLPASGRYQFEDGVRTDVSAFWKGRSSNTWLTGWSIVPRALNY